MTAFAVGEGRARRRGRRNCVAQRKQEAMEKVCATVFAKEESPVPAVPPEMFTTNGLGF
jgi:hypothetical protein